MGLASRPLLFRSRLPHPEQNTCTIKEGSRFNLQLFALMYLCVFCFSRWMFGRSRRGLGGGLLGRSGRPVRGPAMEEFRISSGGATHRLDARANRSGIKYATCRYVPYWFSRPCRGGNVVFPDSNIHKKFHTIIVKPEEGSWKDEFSEVLQAIIKVTQKTLNTPHLTPQTKNY